MGAVLKDHLQRPLLVSRDMSESPLPAVVAQLNNFMKNDQSSDTHPDAEAIEFYLMNHAMSLVRRDMGLYQPLDDRAGKIVAEYLGACSEKAIRAFYYLLLICTRESRHVHYESGFDTKLGDAFGADIKKFNASIHGKGSDTAANALRSAPPNVPLGKYTASLAWTFYKGKFGGGYGGKAWGAVADCLHQFVTGKYTAEMMLDTVWTLCHNNGPIFNKGMLYQCYSGHLVHLLDVQRAGQMPNLIRDLVVKGVTYIPQITARHVSLWKQVCDRFPADFDKQTDWWEIEALGAMNSCFSFQKKQENAFGKPKELEAKMAAAAAKAAAAQAELEAKYFWIGPNEKVKKITRKELTYALAYSG